MSSLFALCSLVNIELLIIFLENDFLIRKKHRILWKKRFIIIEINQYLSKLLSAKNNDFSKFIAGIRKCYEIDFISNDISSLETKTI